MAKLAVRRIKIEAQSKPYSNRKVKKNIERGFATAKTIFTLRTKIAVH